MSETLSLVYAGLEDRTVMPLVAEGRGFVGGDTKKATQFPESLLVGAEGVEPPTLCL